MRQRVYALVLLVVFSATPRAAQTANTAARLPPNAPLDLARVLDLYAEGRFDEAVNRVTQAGDDVGLSLRQQWQVTGRQWIDAVPAQRPQRILIAAALALETEHIRAEHGEWHTVNATSSCAATCVLDWAQILLVQRGPADDAERAWYLAAASLAGGVGDWRYLTQQADRRRPMQLPGLMDRAVARFPADSPLRLERALAPAARFNAIVDGARRAPTILPPAALNGWGEYSVAGIGPDPNAAARMLGELVDDPIVGPEARMRLGYLLWAHQRDEWARNELTMAAERAVDADVRYLARFLLGWFAIKAGDTAGAIPQFEAALAARPGAQSAAVALASLELQRGDADSAHRIARASLDRRDAAADPWRSFLYGHYSQWSTRLAALRNTITP